ncbi:Plasma membrane permease, mediates uptake of glycerophosphoinositol and glycerophosphocholine [Marasmius crinis-equi]|uniref:Plasma membrane permease, mediates uptake of glycerophosphoinositol and glycerophosphocholine n=1 Tax=Marasmius crinis-equi TaxID=585013 RepID=A0ABR3FUF1_9AGAR
MVSSRESRPEEPKTVDTKAEEAQSTPTYAPNRKERLSPYFTILASAFGLISDGYQNNLMTMANVVFKRLYPADYTSAVSTRVSNSLLVGEPIPAHDALKVKFISPQGAIIGQIVVGLICDRIGRKTALVSTTALIVVGAILATAANASTPAGLFWFLTIARGVTGVGVGGEYPASSTSASEAANEKMVKNRGPVFIMVTNFVLSFGGPLAVSVFLIVLSAAGEAHLQTVWRVCFGIGIALPLTVFYFRLRMLSSMLYRKGAIKRKVPYRLATKRYWKALIGTCGAWFLYDFVTFPNGVFSGTIISSVIHDGDLKKTAEWQLLLGALSLPGVFVGAALCNKLGRRNTMMLGFSGYLVFGLIIGLSYDKITKIIPLFVIFYGLMQSFGNLGPGDMLGLVSAESYATPVRGTFYGISAAIGKAGAAVGTQAFTPIQNNLGKKWTFIIAAICGITGILVTYFFVPDMTGIDLADEDEKFVRYLTENGWGGEVGEDDDKGLVGAAGEHETDSTDDASDKL